MKVLINYWYNMFFLIGFSLLCAELAMRVIFVRRFHPEFQGTGWPGLPRAIWHVLTDNRIHLFQVWRAWIRR